LSHEASAAGVSTLTSGNAATQATCQAACESNAECKFYLWRHDPNANAQFTCARFRACPIQVPFGDGDGGHIWTKVEGPTPQPTTQPTTIAPTNSPTTQPTTNPPTPPTTNPPTNSPTTQPTTNPTDLATNPPTEALGWQVFKIDESQNGIDKYCIGGAPKLSHEASAAGVSTLTSGNAATQAACQAACESNAECKFYLWRHDPNANAQFTCARFRACPIQVPFGDGDGGHIWTKVEGPTPQPTTTPTNLPTIQPTNSPTNTPTNPPPTNPPPTNPPTPPTQPTPLPTLPPTPKHAAWPVHQVDGVQANDVYCIDHQGTLSHQNGRTAEGNPGSQEACQALCESLPACGFYLWRHDENAHSPYTCAVFKTCGRIASFGDGDGGHIWRKP
jgi:hypothetical protein